MDSNNQVYIVSIHAPRAGCDDLYLPYLPPVSVSIHAPRAGCDLLILLLMLIFVFQSTHPGRGATV